jgi:hypothetical protein
MKLFELESTQREGKISEQRALEILRSHVKNSHRGAKTTPIFACIKSKHSYLIINPKAKEQKSPFWVDSLTSELPSWSSWPKRSESAIGYTSYDIAESKGEGEGFVILPFDGAKLCISSAPSFYKSLTHAAKLLGLDKVDNVGLKVWVERLYEVASAVGMDAPAPELTKGSQVLVALDNLKELKGQHVKKLIVDNASINGASAKAALSFIERTSTPLNYLSQLMDPDDNGFTTVTTASTLPASREIWTSSKCLAFKVDDYERLFKQGEIK